MAHARNWYAAFCHCLRLSSAGGGRRAAFWLVLCLINLGCDATAAETSKPAIPVPTAATRQALEAYTANVRPLLASACFDCHGSRKVKGEVNLEALAAEATAPVLRPLWRSVAEQVRSGAMPPSTDKHPITPLQRETMLRWIADLRKLDPPSVGRGVARRLNRVEYDNTMRDLLGVDLRLSAEFPEDGMVGGFSNQGDALSLSPLLMEKYLAAAERALDQVIKPGRFTRTWDIGTLNVTRGGVAQPTDTSVGERVLTSGMIVSVPLVVPKPGRLTVSLRAGVQAAGKEAPRLLLTLGSAKPVELRVSATSKQPRDLSVSIEADAGEQVLTLALAQANPKAADAKPAADARAKAGQTPPPGQAGEVSVLLVGDLSVLGPAVAAPPPQQARLLVAMPNKTVSRSEAATRVLTTFATRAYRRPPSDDDLALLLRVFTLADSQGASFEEAITLAFKAVLISGKFLYRLEPDRAAGADGAFALDDWELAARLSYFLWNSMPDEELFTLARAGRLRDPTVLAAQAKRLLADRKAQAMIEDFTVHWLELRQLPSLAPDPKLFPDFTPTLRNDLRQEAVQVMANVVREDLSVVELLTGNWTMLNERLAKHYGIGNVVGSSWRKVVLSDPQRGGVLGLGAVMATTSYPTRTSVVQRGKWVLEQLLDQPPPPPPAMVAALDQQAVTTTDGRQLSQRERLERHRADPACAACHRVMDGIGVGLENFDALGRWRERDGSAAIDGRGELDGTAFTGPAGLKRLLAAREQDFLRCLTTKLVTYALGRRCGDQDEDAIAEIMRAGAASDQRFSALVTALVTNRIFRFRQTHTGDAQAPH